MMRARLSSRANPARQRGVAVILALLIVMLATTLAVYMAQQQDMWQQQVENQFNWVQARSVGGAAVDWARAVLADDASSSNYDYPGEMWTKQLPAATVENGQVAGVIEDQQGLFNLNNLVRNGATSGADVERFQRLLALIGLPGDLAVSLADWMDADGEVQYPGGAEDAYYLGLPQPYRAANRPLVELDELLLVKGYDAETLKRLRPYVTVLPVPTPINVNFAPPEVLAAMVDGLSISLARSVAQQRATQPFRTLADFNSRLPSQMQVPDTLATVSSQYFMVKGYASFGKSQVVMEALLQRNGVQSTVIWQDIE
jgi:general secretion pathway protein K